ncbi:MAG: hypothetical protein ACM3JH_04270 [Acidithiobacillales bacterium]
MVRGGPFPALLAALAALPLLSQGVETLDFEPRIGATNARVVVKYPAPPGSSLRFGDKPVAFVRENVARLVFFVPPGASSSFIEVRLKDKVIAKSAVPFVVSGPSVTTPKLVGLKEAIDVFAYQDDPTPEGGSKPQTPVKPILRIGDSDILTIGEPSPQQLPLPAVNLGDANSAATRSMGPAAFQITARPPVKRVTLPTPTPTPTPPAPASAHPSEN